MLVVLSKGDGQMKRKAGDSVRKERGKGVSLSYVGRLNLGI